MKKFFLICLFCLISLNLNAMSFTKCHYIKYSDNEKAKDPKFNDKVYKEHYFNIDFNNSIVGRVIIYTDEYWKKNESWLGKPNSVNTHKAQTNIHKFKISFADNKRIEASRKTFQDHVITYFEQVIIDVGKATVDQNGIMLSDRKDILYQGTVKCKKSGGNGSGYLDYWWAVILIIAITFFIFTQSGKRLKKIRRK